MIVGIIVGIMAVAVIAGFVFVNQPSFGRAPQGERLERIKKSPHYKDGEFRNLHSTMIMTSQKGRLGAFWGYYGCCGHSGIRFCQSAEFREGSSRRTVGEDKEVASLQRRRIPESAQYDDDDFPKGTFGSFLGILI